MPGILWQAIAGPATLALARLAPGDDERPQAKASRSHPRQHLPKQAHREVEDRSLPFGHELGRERRSLRLGAWARSAGRRAPS